ncbi:MAG: DUF2213 domain-containing protein [Pyrinomonadaceae bacterium]
MSFKHTVFDRTSYGPVTSRVYTDEGFLKVPGRVARTGIQEYLARELGLDGDPNRIIKVMRPPEEVFHADSLATYDGADVTINHPKGFVTTDNYSQLSKGTARGAVQDGDYVTCNLFVKSKDAIAAINSGKCELSAGYTAIYEEAKDGDLFDFIQREIRINHVALVDNARAGANARVFDENPEKKTMTHKVMLDSGRSVEVQDEATALLVSDTIERLAQKVADAEAKSEKAQAAADVSKEKLDAAALLSSDEAIKVRVAKIAGVQVAARKIAGDSFECDSVDTVEIMRAAMAKVRPGVEWSDKSVAYLEAAFDMAAEEEEEEDGKMKDTAAQLAQAAQDAAKPRAAADAKPSAYQLHKQSLENAHKGKA